MIRIGSLFTGIGLFDLGVLWGLALAGLRGEIAYQVEIDPFCRGVLARHFPRAIRFGDVTKVRGADLPSADVVLGSWPCQDLSVAGRGAGLDGARSGLWRDLARIVEETRPRAVCLENVAALTSRGLDRVVLDLERVGYHVAATLVRASDIGAPHRRERIFIMAHTPFERRQKGSRTKATEGTARAGDRRLARAGASEHVADSDGQRRPRLTPIDGTNGSVGEQSRDHASRRGAGMADADRGAVRYAEQRVPGRRARGVRNGGEAEPRHDRESRRRVVEPGLGRMPDGMPDWMVRWPARPGDPQLVWEPPRAVNEYSPTRNARLQALGNAIVPQLVALRFGPILAEVFGT